MQARLDTIDSVLAIESLSVRFQPIVTLADERRVVAYEALVRGPIGSLYESADVLFDYVRFKREEPRADRACVERIMAAIHPFSDDHFSINVHASTLERDPFFSAFFVHCAHRNGVALSRLIVEVVEQSRYWNAARLSAAVDKLRDAGATIAIDDLGSGFGNFKMIVDVRPSILKLDGTFTRGCATNSHCRSIARSVLQLAADIGGIAVAEGIESAEDLRMMRELGYEVGQGYALARPNEAAAFGMRTRRSGFAPVLAL